MSLRDEPEASDRLPESPFQGLRRGGGVVWVSGLTGLAGEVFRQSVQIDHGSEDHVFLTAAFQGVADAPLEGRVLPHASPTHNTVVFTTLDQDRVKYAVVLREQVRAKHLRTKPLFGRSFTEDVQFLQESGPPPMTFFCHNSPTL